MSRRILAVIAGFLLALPMFGAPSAFASDPGGPSAAQLDATNNSSADGTRLQIWDCAGSTNQKWTVA